MSRSGTTTAAGVINYVIAGLTLAAGAIFGFIALTAGSSTTTDSTDVHKAIAAIAGFVAVIAIVFGVALWLIGRAFMHGKSWARVTLIVLYALSLLSGLTRISHGGTAPFGVMFDIAMLVLLLVPSTGRDFSPSASYQSSYSQPYNQPQTHPAFLGTPYASPAPAAGPPAGWYPDPQLPTSRRYWDGRAWTAHIQSGS